jgi:hypothetical protein
MSEWLNPLKDENGEQPTPGSFVLEGRLDPLELVVHALNETGATGVGAVLVDEDQEI